MTLFDPFIVSVKEKNLGVYGICIFKNGKSVDEYRFRSNDRENLYSASKVFTSIAVGIAEGEGLLYLSDYALDFFPEYEAMASKGSEKITLKNLLQMSSGHMTEDFSLYNSMDRAELFFKTEIKNKPGSTFFYEDLCSYMLGRIIHKVSGNTLLEYLKPRLFTPLGIINPQWHTCQLGYTSGSGGLYLSTEEFSRIGILLLQKGQFDHQQIVSVDYVRRMHLDLVDSTSKNDLETKGGYGYQVWKCTPQNTYRADGMYGQFCIVAEDYNAVITVTGHNENEPKEILRCIWKDILPNL